MRKTVGLLLAFLIIFAFSLEVFSFRVVFDGSDNGMEWENSQVISLLSGESHSNITTAVLKYYVDYETHDIWMCVMIIDKLMEPNDEDIRLLIFAENEEIIINPSQEYSPVNTDKYTVDAKFNFDSAHGLTSEIRLGIKNGIPDEYTFRIQFADSQGTLSNIKNVVIRNPSTTVLQSETEPETTKPTTQRETTTKPERTTKERTTKEKTTKEKTTKIRTTKEKTTKLRTEKATAEKPTRVDITKDEPEICTVLPAENITIIVVQSQVEKKTRETETTEEETDPIPKQIVEMRKHKAILFAMTVFSIAALGSFLSLDYRIKKIE